MLWLMFSGRFDFQPAHRGRRAAQIGRSRSADVAARKVGFVGGSKLYFGNLVALLSIFLFCILVLNIFLHMLCILIKHFVYVVF